MVRPDPIRVARRYAGIFSPKFDYEQERIIDDWVRSNKSRWSKMVDQAHWLNDDKYRQPSFFFWKDLPEDLQEALAPSGLLRKYRKPDRPFIKAVINYLTLKAMQ